MLHPIRTPEITNLSKKALKVACACWAQQSRSRGMHTYLPHITVDHIKLRQVTKEANLGTVHYCVKRNVTTDAVTERTTVR